MAYGLRLTIECSSVTGDNAEIKVYKEGYAGEAVIRNGGEVPFQIKWGDGSKELFPLIYGSQLTASFIIQTDFEFVDLLATNARDIYIEIILNETDKIWYGFIDPGTYNEQLIAPQFEVSFDAYDGLGLLKDEDFADTDKTPYEGEYTLLAILQLILAKTGLSLPLNTCVNFRPSEMLSTSDVLTQVKKDLITYQEMTCYEVIESIFKNCRIFQRSGEWYIISNDAWGLSSITCYAYTSAGVANGTKTIDPALSGWYIMDIGKMDMIAPLKQISFSQDYGYKNNLIQNSDFSETDGSGNFDNWTATNVLPEQRAYDEKGNKYVYIPGTERLDPWDSSNRTKYMVSDAIAVAAASDLFKISLSYALMGPKNNSAYVFFGMFLDGDDGNDYALEAYYYTEPNLREVRYRWTVSANKLAVPVAAHIKRTKVFLGADTFDVEPDRIEAYPFDEVINNFKTAEITVEGGIPTSGTLKIYLFAAHTGGTVAGNCFREIKLMLTDEDENEYITNVENVLINSLRNNVVPEDINFINTDIPDIANRLTIYNGGFLLNDGSGEATRLWKHDSFVNTYTFAELMTRMIASEIRIPKQKYTLKLGDSELSTAMVITDANNSNKKFVESGITYTFHTNQTEGTFIEVTALNITDYTVATIKEISDSGNSNSSGSSGKQAVIADFDEKVAMIDPDDLTIEGQPGYLNAKEFKQNIDETTGRSVISKEVLLIHENYIARTQPSATGDNSVAIGEGTEAASFRQIVLGSFNTNSAGTADSWVATDPIFIVGNGTDDANRSDAFVVLKNGNIEMLGGTFTGISTGAANNDKLTTKGYVDDAISGISASQWTTDAYGIYYNSGNVTIGDNNAASDYKFNVLSTSKAAYFQAGNTSSDIFIRTWSASTVKHEFYGNGAVRFYNYGSGTFSGTATKWLAVDSSGNIIEEDPPSATSSQWTTDAYGIYYNSGNVTIGDTSAASDYKFNVISTSKAAYFQAGSTSADIFLRTYSGSTVKHEFYGDGKVRFYNYGSGTFTGTAAKWLAVDSSGNIIEQDAPSGGVSVSGTPSANQVAYWTNSSTLAGDADMTFDGTTLTIKNLQIGNGNAGNYITFPRISTATYVPSTTAGFGLLWMSSADNHLYFRNSTTDFDLCTGGTTYSEGEGIDISAGVISGEDATTTNKGISSFSSTNFSVTSGAVSIASGGIQASNLNANVISGQTALTSGLASTDELLISDAGVLKRMDVSVLRDYLQSALTLSFAEYSASLLNGNSTQKTVQLLSSSNPSYIGLAMINLTTSANAYYGRAVLLISGSYNGGTLQINYDSIINSPGSNVTVSASSGGSYVTFDVLNNSGQTLNYTMVYSQL